MKEPQLPLQPPDLEGAHGKAWRLDVDAIVAKVGGSGSPPELTVSSWVVHAPWAHSFWHSYFIACVSLRPMPGVKPAEVYLEGATHEVMVYALVPAGPVKLDDVPAIMLPANFHGQFIEPTDEAAATRIEAAVRDICAGQLSPDTDFQSVWVARFSGSNLKAVSR